MTQVRTIDRRGVTDTNPFPTSLPEYEDGDGMQLVNVLNIGDPLLDVLERIQQQLGFITGINLNEGERIE